MAIYIKHPTRIKSTGNKIKIIDEYIGLVNSNNSDVSIARMQSPPGWEEPSQTPDFDEYTIVLKGSMHVRTDTDHFVINAGEAFIAKRGERIQYSTPDPDGAEYIAVCLPAFTPQTVNREH